MLRTRIGFVGEALQIESGHTLTRVPPGCTDAIVDGTLTPTRGGGYRVTDATGVVERVVVFYPAVRKALEKRGGSYSGVQRSEREVTGILLSLASHRLGDVVADELSAERPLPVFGLAAFGADPGQ